MLNKRISVLGNLLIDTPIKLEHLKYSFDSFFFISDNWVINIRGQFKSDAEKYLKQKLGNKLVLFDLVNDNKGWFNNVLNMVGSIKNDYVFLWNEDHMAIIDPPILKKFVGEIIDKDLDYIIYSAWFMGEYERFFKELDQDKGKYLDSIYLTKQLWKDLRKKGYRRYIISMPGIFRRSFLVHLLQLERNRLPLIFSKIILRCLETIEKLGLPIYKDGWFYKVNQLFFLKLKKYPKNTPFDIEKDPARLDILPIKIGVPKIEVFGCIDDDIGVPGYQLIKRGIYPPLKKITHTEGKKIKYNWGERESFGSDRFFRIERYNIGKGKKLKISQQGDDLMRGVVQKDLLILTKGTVKFSVDNSTAILKSRDMIEVYINKSNYIEAKEKARVLLIKHH